MKSKLNFQTEFQQGIDCPDLKFECFFSITLGYLLFTFSHSCKKVRYSKNAKEYTQAIIFMCTPAIYLKVDLV